MSIEKVDIDNQGWTYSSYVKAGDFIFTSICSGFGDTIKEAWQKTKGAKGAIWGAVFVMYLIIFGISFAGFW